MAAIRQPPHNPDNRDNRGAEHGPEDDPVTGLSRLSASEKNGDDDAEI